MGGTGRSAAETIAIACNLRLECSIYAHIHYWLVLINPHIEISLASFTVNSFIVQWLYYIASLHCLSVERKRFPAPGTCP